MRCALFVLAALAATVSDQAFAGKYGCAPLSPIVDSQKFLPPEMSRKIPYPPFPLEIVQKRGPGRFIGDMVISDSGVVTDVLVTRNFYKPFDAQLIDLLKREMAYKPATLDGAPTASKCRIEYKFDI